MRQDNRCPNCKLITLLHHCNSPHCEWRSCKRCVLGPGEYVVFDPKKRYFIGRDV